MHIIVYCSISMFDDISLGAVQSFVPNLTTPHSAATGMATSVDTLNRPSVATVNSADMHDNGWVMLILVTRILVLSRSMGEVMHW